MCATQKSIIISIKCQIEHLSLCLQLLDRFSDTFAYISNSQLFSDTDHYLVESGNPVCFGTLKGCPGNPVHGLRFILATVCYTREWRSNHSSWYNCVYYDDKRLCIVPLCRLNYILNANLISYISSIAVQVSLTQARIDMSELDEDSDGFLQPHVWCFTLLSLWLCENRCSCGSLSFNTFWKYNKIWLLTSYCVQSHVY